MVSGFPANPVSAAALAIMGAEAEAEAEMEVEVGVDSDISSACVGEAFHGVGRLCRGWCWS